MRKRGYEQDICHAESALADIDIIPVRDFTYDETLGTQERAVIMVKWANQLYHDTNLRAMHSDDWDPVRGISRQNSATHRNQYYPGLLAVASLDTDYLTRQDAAYTEEMLQPTAVHSRYGQWVIAAANRLLVRPELEDPDQQTVIDNPWFARLHSAEFTSPDRITTISTSFDYILEVDLEGNIVWSVDPWDQGYGQTKTGYILRKKEGPLPHMHDPDPKFLRQPAPQPGATAVITRPELYDGLGLPTYTTPVYVNGVHQASDNSVLATTFQRGEAWVITKPGGTIHPVVEGLRQPHGFIPYHDGYLLSDTGREHILFLDQDFRIHKALSLNEFDDRKAGLAASRWLQNTTVTPNGLLLTISAPRQKVTIIDPAQETYRDIHFDPNWGIQTLYTLPNDQESY